jgi:hypothetical protein
MNYVPHWMDGLWKNTINIGQHSIYLKPSISGIQVSNVAWQSKLPKHVVTVSEYPTKKKTVKVKVKLTL